MLVEDDNSLLEIYEARLKAEGYDIVTARDGEEALTVALKEHPDLIIADVMMPKVSGFDMVDILRSTPETKATKIIMMTALNQAEDKARAEKLGADKYLVKSQVTLEDVARIVHDVLAEQDAAAAAAVTSATGIEPSVTQPKASPTSPASPINPIVNAAAAQPSAPKPVAAPILKPATVQPPAPSDTETTPVVPNSSTAPKIATTIPVSPAPEPTKSIPITSMPKVTDQQPPAGPQNTTAAPASTSIPVTSTDDEDESNTNDHPVKQSAVKDPFLAKNPTLSDSPEVTAQPDDSNYASNIAKPQEADNSIAQKAVESLAPPSDTTTPSDNQESASDNSVTTKYLKTDKDDKSKSMTHDKVIEPTLSTEDDDSPALTNLSEISDAEVASTPPPAVNTVITPDPDKGSTNSSQN